MKRWLKRIFSTKNYEYHIFKGDIYQVQAGYADLLKLDIEIVSTALSKDYTKYGYTETFVLIVTYIRY